MKTIHKKSPIPIYGIAALWLIWAVALPMYKTSDFLLLAAASCAVYFVLSKFFPGETVQVEEPPVPTGDADLDELLNKGREAAAQYKTLIARIDNAVIKEKAEILAGLTAQIFADLKEHPAGKSQVKRFAGYFLPAPIKLLEQYAQLEERGVKGENIFASMERIEKILDTTIEAYRKQIDAMFEGRALDIETDIEVLEAMLKREGLAGSDF